jgi:hypothetical protein
MDLVFATVPWSSTATDTADMLFIQCAAGIRVGEPQAPVFRKQQIQPADRWGQGSVTITTRMKESL